MREEEGRRDGEEEHTLQQLELELCNSRASLAALSSKLEEQERRKADAISDLQRLRERIDREEYDSAVLKLVPVLRLLKDLESRESVLKSDYDAKRSELGAEICELEDKIAADCDVESLSEDLDAELEELVGRLNAAKKELASRLRAVLSMKRQLDDVPTQAELIQYERRFSELNAHIQEKHRQTRKYYATYNALLEIKDLMLKETSLLNSISSQFQDAITSTDGRMKLVGSMEGIVKGSQQKLKKVQVELQEEQKVCDALKTQYAGSMAEQRRYYALLKAFQEECAKNLRLKSPCSA